MKIFHTMIAALVLTTSISAQAHAGGFITDLLEDTGVISEDEGAFLDGIHDQLNRPLETLGGAVADAWVPGSGAVVQEIWDNNRQGGGMQARRPQGRPMQQQMRFGYYCATQFGMAGPGPAQPVGSMCFDVFGNPGTIR